MNYSKIYIICKDCVYKYVEDYILSFKKSYMEFILYTWVKNLPPITKFDTYIFIKFIPAEILLAMDNTYNNIYLLNIEQLTRPKQYKFINSFPKNIKMLDYAKANMPYYDGYYNKFLPYQINDEEIYNFPKEYDICIIACEVQTTRRENIINDFLTRGYKIDVISGWKKERDERLFRYKIIINVSFDATYKIFESLRCDRCILNKMIVISEKKENMELYNLKDYMIFDDYENIVNKAIEVLNNYDMYYSKLQLDTLNFETLPIQPITPDYWFN